jgi:hypothetical protein
MAAPQVGGSSEQPQTPGWPPPPQVSPTPLQTAPQAPQFASLSARSTQLPPQLVRPAGQGQPCGPGGRPVALQTQAQPGPANWSGGQATQAGPLAVLQTEAPAGQRQIPSVQAAPLQQPPAAVQGWP